VTNDEAEPIARCTMSRQHPGEPTWTYKLSRPAAERAGIRVHLVGIGGSGLSAIAVLLLELGFAVSGSDQRPNETTDELARRGVTIYRGHHASQVAGADLVLISSAIPGNNPEVMAAIAAGIPVLKRQEFLGPLMEGLHGIGIAGTHGKTTTTGMIAVVLLRAGLDPSFIIGSKVSVGPAEGMASQTLAAPTRVPLRIHRPTRCCR
jgi:UDP-N-acetylmuramate-alanine ligase